MSPSVSVLTGVGCLDCQDLTGGGGAGRGLVPQQSCPVTFSFVPTGWFKYCPVYSFSARPLNCFFKKHIGKDHLNRSVNMQNKEDD